MGRPALNQRQGGGTKRKRKRNAKQSGAETSRRRAFKKRMLVLKTKACELAELCPVTVCWVCFGPDGEVVTWPENQTTVRDIIGTFQGLGEDNKCKQSYDFLRVLRDKKRKFEGEIKGRNLNKQFVGNFSREELVDLRCKLESKSQAVYNRINSLQNQIREKKGKAIKVYKFSDLLSTQTVESAQPGGDGQIGQNPLMGSSNSFHGDLFSSEKVQSHHDVAQLTQSDHDGDGQIGQNPLMGSPNTYNGDLSDLQFLLLDPEVPPLDFMNDSTMQSNEQKCEDWLSDYGYSGNEIGTTETNDDDLVPKNLDEISVGWTDDEDIDAFLNLDCPSLWSEDASNNVTSDK
ncbi:agamous-like MADS-box protein AGL81 [Tripterygium wilfordii]|uniref:agamous-like MADS-box protein AGL81 n=1 Tax=Tripterygium wilfordii TaxID=458696 RepID=UPI0018F7E96A|nr:agamous-like MADS-box protein AGL81 [Tripterygium wilfordii]